MSSPQSEMKPIAIPFTHENINYQLELNRFSWNIKKEVPAPSLSALAAMGLVEDATTFERIEPSAEVVKAAIAALKTAKIRTNSKRARQGAVRCLITEVVSGWESQAKVLQAIGW